MTALNALNDWLSGNAEDLEFSGRIAVFMVPGERINMIIKDEDTCLLMVTKKGGIEEIPMPSRKGRVTVHGEMKEGFPVAEAFPYLLILGDSKIKALLTAPAEVATSLIDQMAGLERERRRSDPDRPSLLN